jgi:very-short-patch-repair endonuclease
MSEFDDTTDLARHLRRAATEAETTLWRLLRHRKRRQRKFRRQHPIGPFVVDFYCAEAKLAVECDGAPHFTTEGKKRDVRRTKWLNSQGIEVIRFTSHEIEDETQQVLATIDSAIERRLSGPRAPHPPAPSPRGTEEKGSSQFQR